MCRYPTAGECRKLLQTAGVTGSTFTLNDFLQMLQANRPSSTNHEAEVIGALKAFDDTGTGMIRVGDLKHALTAIGQKLSPQAAGAFLAAADRDGSGVVPIRQVAALLTSGHAA